MKRGLSLWVLSWFWINHQFPPKPTMPWAIQKLWLCIIRVHIQAKGEAPVRITPGCLAQGTRETNVNPMRCSVVNDWPNGSTSLRETVTQAVAYKTLSQMWVVCKSVQEGAREITEGDGRQTNCFSKRRCSGHWCRTGKIWDALYGADFSGNEKPCVMILSTKAQGASQSWVSRKNVKR